MNEMLKKIRETRRQLSSIAPPLADSITDVVVILGSSRSGSTLLHKIISSHPEINSLPGEEQTYFNLFGYQNSVDDRLQNIEINYEDLACEILYDIGSKPEEISSNEIIRRILLQWPEHLYDLTNNHFSDVNQAIKLLNLPLHFYENQLGTHSDFHHQHTIIEEPPFIFPTKINRFVKNERNILLLKSSSNSYRMDHLLKIFPRARYHYILLKRDYKQVINGLYDGWQSSGFHSHYFPNFLNISDYPSHSWWKFDLPPNWENYINHNLIDICAFQWKSNYEYILNFLSNNEFYSINYDDFFDLDTLNQKLNIIFEKLNITYQHHASLPQAMTTYPPQKDRWKEKAALIQQISSQKIYQEFNNEILNF